MESFNKKKNSNNAEKIVMRAEKIKSALGFEWEEFKNKTLLDVGSGCGEFVQVAREKGIDAYGIDELHPTEARTPEQLGYITNDGASNEGLVVGNADQLPFEEGTFDYVCTHASVPLIGRPTEETISAQVEEMLRVVKEGGEVRIAPFVQENQNERTQLAQQKFLTLYPHAQIIDNRVIIIK